MRDMKVLLGHEKLKSLARVTNLITKQASMNSDMEIAVLQYTL